MALNIQTFKTRALTSLIFVLVMFAGLLWNHWSFFILFSVIHFGCWVEYQKLIGLIDKDYSQINPFHKYGIMIAGWCIMLYFARTGDGFTQESFSILGIGLHELGWWLGLISLFLLPVIEVMFAKQFELKNIGYSALGILYISLSWGLFVDLRFGPPTLHCYGGHSMDFHNYPFAFPLILVVSIWINDTMAYLVGSFIGKTPLSKISPKKTWEGTIGGAVLCIAVMAIAGYSTRLFHIHDWIAIGSIVAITGNAGDLLESKLKRMAGVKDSGSLMPGHGGFLDRFDSLLIATPFVWLYVNLFM